MKNVPILLCLLCMHTTMYAQYISSTVEQVSAATVPINSIQNPIIRVKIEVGANPTDLYALFWNTSGSTNPATDIDTSRIFYTGSSNLFSTGSPFVSGPLSLSAGTHYFWLAYDVSANAIVCDTLDAECYTVYVSEGTQTPSVTAPAGYAVIGNCETGTHSPALSSPAIQVFPNPFSSETHVYTGIPVQDASLSIFNTSGERVKQVEHISGQALTLSRDQLPAGLYFLHLTEGGLSMSTGKWVMID